jgi:alkylated DNA repair protein alkB family protein 1
MEDAELDQDLEIVDFTRGLTDAQKERIVPVGTVTSSTIAAAQEAFVKFGSESANGRETKPRPCALPEECTVYEHKNFDGQALSRSDKEWF